MEIVTLDRIDRKLINALQRSNLEPTRALADSVHISQPTCLRRIRHLRETGVIKADVSIVDPFDLNHGLVAFLEVSLADQSEERMREFEERAMKETEVLQCYLISGEFDFFLLVHVIDMDAYYNFIRRVISAGGNIRHFESRFPMKRVKFSTRIVFDERALAVEVRAK